MNFPNVKCKCVINQSYALLLVYVFILTIYIFIMNMHLFVKNHKGLLLKLKHMHITFQFCPSNIVNFFKIINIENFNSKLLPLWQKFPKICFVLCKQCNIL
jgi:hypothetical protein